MKKRIALMATAALCALAICLSAIPALPIFAEEGAEPENVALGKTVTITDGASIENEQNGIAALTDGRFGWYANQPGGQRGWIKEFAFIPSEENPLDIVIDLDGLYEIGAFTIHPTTSYNACFPTYFEIQVSATEDGDDWVTVHSDEDVVINGRLSSSAPIENYDPNNKYDVALDETETACRVRIHITEPSDCWEGETTNYMGFGEIEVYGVEAATEEEEPEFSIDGLVNASIGATATVADDFHVDGFFRIDYAFDGVVGVDADLGWHASVGAVPTVDEPMNVDAALDGTYEIQAIRIYPMNFYNGVSVMPSAFLLQLSDDNGATWETVASATDVTSNVEGSGGLAGRPAANNPLTFVLDEAVVATNFRMVIQAPSTETPDGANLYVCIGEVELWGTPAEAETETETETTPEEEPELVDVALNQYAEATFSIEGGGWGAQGLLMGLKSGAQLANNDPAGWHHDMSGTISALHAPEITIYLDGVCTIYTIDLYPVNAYNDAYVSVMPQDFKIELSADGGQTWVTVATETGVISQVAAMEGHNDNGGLPAINAPYSIVLEEPTDANMFRMTMTKGGTGRSSNTALADPTYGGVYAPFTSIGSIELLGVVGEAPEETETETETVTETETETVTETETETETVVESEDESLDESVEESETTDETTDETVGETVVGETTAETTAGTTAGTDAPAADEGCASVVGLGAVAVLTAAAAAIVLKKKD